MGSGGRRDEEGERSNGEGASEQRWVSQRRMGSGEGGSQGGMVKREGEGERIEGRGGAWVEWRVGGEGNGGQARGERKTGSGARRGRGSEMR